MKVLIGDRSELICERLSAMFGSHTDIEVVAKINDADVINESIKKFSPDVIILDTDMLGNSGTSIISNLKKKLCSILLITLTDNSISQYRSRYLNAGSDYHFDKAYEFNKIPDAVHSLKIQYAG